MLLPVILLPMKSKIRDNLAVCDAFCMPMTLLLAICALGFTACFAQAQEALHVASAAPPSDHAVVSCTQGPLFSCDVPPFEDLATEACSYLRRQLEGRRFGDQLIQRVIACETPILSKRSKLGTAAAVTARLEVDGPPVHGAFLFVRFTNGWRAVDQLLEPAWTHGGYCKTRFQLSWERKSTQADAILNTMSERVCHMPLDQEELSARESDIASSECRHARYMLSDNRLMKIAEREFARSCLFR